MESADGGTATSQKITFGALIATLQPQADSLLEKIYEFSLSLFPNSTLANMSANQITTYEAIEVAIRRRRNGLAAINRVTIDIIHCIFAEVLDLDRIHDADYPLDRVEAHRKQLFRLRCVSSQWNEFILASPRYWSAINIGVSSEVIIRTMERAQHVPLCLYALLPTGTAGREMWRCNHLHRQTLQNQIAQVRSIRTNSPEASQFCETLLSRRPPILETLELTWPQSRWGTETIKQLPAGLEHLHQVKAVDWRPNEASSQLCKLQTLVLGGSPRLGARTIHLLAKCINLLTLVFHEHDGWPSGSTAPVPTATLPRLQELTLDFKGVESPKFLLKRLAFPPQSKGSLRIEYPSYPDAEVIDTLSNFILPNTAARPIPDGAVINIHRKPDQSTWATTRIIYSAGVRSVDLGGPTSSDQAAGFTKLIKAFQTRLNDPPLTIKLINYQKTDFMFRRLADVDVRKVLVKAPKDFYDVLWLIGSSHPSGIRDKPQLPFASLQELSIEDARINAKQLIGMVATRRRLLRAISQPCLRKISLVNCRLIDTSLEKITTELAVLGVVLIGTGCTFFRGK
ncbi:hypothetical protein FRC05_003736 [Tulasnella sp. 425]|nr:hypothetical protein FRC05_003736 [Tulasnella sp. 425]